MEKEFKRNKMSRKYLAFFRMRFTAGLQYRAAAASGIVTQFVWGIMQLLIFRAFYEVNKVAFPMKFSEVSTYIWLQQSLLALFVMWILENDIFQIIVEGGIAYELCRPVDLYYMWFFRSMANRLSKAVLRCLPIILFAAILPVPYGMRLPSNTFAAAGFLITLALGFVNVIAFCMLVYIITFFTYSPSGIRLFAVSLVELLGGAVVPLPFFPEGIRQVAELLPFAAMQNIPFRIYSGNIAGVDILSKIAFQLFWALVLIWLGRCLTKAALKRAVVQGG